jgi:hypothetical protein
LWLIITLVSLVVLFLLILSIPIDLALRLDVNGRVRFNLKLLWLFGLLGKELGRRKKKAKPKKAKPKKDKEKSKDARKVLKVLRTKGLLKQIKVFVTDVFKSLSIRQLRADFRIGLDNPADTGLLFACIGPAFVFLNHPGRYSVNIKPSFEDEAILEGYMQAVIRLLPIKLVLPLLKFAFSFPILRVIKAMVLIKWKRKK